MKSSIMKFLSIVGALFVAALTIIACSKSESATPEPIVKEDPKEETPTNNPPSSFDLTGLVNEATDVDLLPTFGWEASTDADGDSVSYDLYLSTEADPVLHTEGLSDTSFTVMENLDFGATYYWKVVAQDGNEGSVSSAIFSFTTKENSLPSAFELIGVTDGAVDVDVLPTFSWEEAIDPDGDLITYDLYLGTGVDSMNVLGANLTSKELEVSEPLLYGQNYYWKIVAKDENGGTTSSVIFSFTTEDEELNAPAKGDLIITEVMVDPDSVSDSQGEWFEIYNVSDQDHEMKGLEIRTSATNFSIEESVIINSNSYLIVGREKDTNLNGGVIVDIEYQNMTLHNAGGEIKLLSDAVVIDEIIYNSFPYEVGKSMILGLDFFDSVENDSPENWCTSTNEMPSGDFGTPRSQNGNCN